VARRSAPEVAHPLTSTTAAADNMVDPLKTRIVNSPMKGDGGC
jgi:hypothetical protein